MKKRSLYEINLNLNYNMNYEKKCMEKIEELRTRPFKAWHIYACETIGALSFMGMSTANSLDLGNGIIAGLCGACVGACTPWLVRKIKIGELKYQIYMNKGILEGLEKEKKQKIDKVKTLRK